MILDCFKALNDVELDEVERLYAALIIFYEDFEDIEDIIDRQDMIKDLSDAMFLFFNQGQEELQSNTGGHKLIDWDKDSNLICSAINNISKQEIRSLEYLHWWTFLGYYTAIGECPLSNIVAIRYKIANGEKLEKHEKKFVQDNPDYFNIDMRSNTQKEAEEYIRQLWGES